MKLRVNWRMSAIAAALALSACSAGAAETVILDSHGYWRTHYTFAKPVYGKRGSQVTKFGYETPAPPENWTSADFDDSGWRYIPGPPFPPYSNWSQTCKQNTGWGSTDSSSPGVALICMRGKFKVHDPADGLSVSVSYRGGVVLYVNGKEIGRANVAKGGKGLLQPAEDYPDEAFLNPDGKIQREGRGEKDAEKLRRWRLHKRRLEGVKVPRSVLRKGVNVLAVEVHRAPYHAKFQEALDGLKGHEKQYHMWSTCGLEKVRMTFSGSGGVEPNAVRPKGVQAWNSDTMSPDFTLDWGDRNEPLRPVRIIAARNGSFSGKIIVGSDAPIKGLKATMSDLTSGGDTIPASAVRIRYATPAGSEQRASVRYVKDPGFLQVLEDEPPAEVPVRPGTRGNRLRPWNDSATPAPLWGAVQPVWVTVDVPSGARPGEYTGNLAISAGDRTVNAAIALRVNGLRLPSPMDFHTWIDLVPSPESVAMKYGVEPYSDRHFELMAKSLDIMGYLGSDTMYVPLICRTNLGNEQSMVRWVKKGAGYTHDFSVFERYLDLVLKHQGKPAMVILTVWDKPFSSKKVPVSVVGGGKVETVELPPLTDSRSLALWKPLADGLKARLAKRGLGGRIILGIVPDGPPSKGVVDFYAKVFPGAKWMRHAHSNRRDVNGGPLGYQCLVWTPQFPNTPECKPMKGWKRQDLMAQFIRSRDMFPMVHFRLMAEMNVAGTQRGFGRLGLDFWPVLKDKRGRLRGSIQARFPETGWNNLDWMLRAFTHPGPDGALPTMRTEMMREGLQECEARIIVEKALDAGKLGGSLKARAEKLVQDRTWMVRIALDNHLTDGFAKDTGHAWWSTPAQTGYNWYIQCWPEYSRELYDLATDVAVATKAIPSADANPEWSGAATASGGPGRPAARRQARPPAMKRPPAVPRRPRGGLTEEAKAKRLWSSAQNFLKNGATALGRRKLEELVSKYPGTGYAKEAREKIAELEED